jgi:Mannosyltransferase (PIG-V)
MTGTHAARVMPFDRARLWEALLPFLVTRLPLVVAGTLSVALLPLSRYVPNYWIITGIDRVFDAFSRWDAWHYTRIAEFGYPSTDPSRAAFFPLFPTLTRIVAELQGRTDRPGLFVAAILVANICLVMATMVLAALVRLDLEPDDARRSVWYLLVFPTSLFLSAGYSESLFLLLTVGAVLACRTDRWLWAAGLALLAAVTRPVGLVIVVPLAVEAFVAWRASGRWRWRPVVAVVAPFVGIGAWMLFLNATFHDPLAFVHAQKGWDRSLELPWDTFFHFFEGRLTLESGLHSLTDLTFTVAGIALVLLAWRWLRTSYALYMTGLLVVPLLTGTLLSMPRFLLVMFPMYLVLAIMGRRVAVHETLLVVGMGLGCLFMALYAQWYWVA